MARPWIKLKPAILTDPKYGMLSNDAYILFINMLRYSSTKNTDGYIGKIRFEEWPRLSTVTGLCLSVDELEKNDVIRLDSQGNIWISDMGSLIQIGRDFTRKSLTQSERNYIHYRDNYSCVYCGSPSEEVDHVIPVSKGGTNDPDNLVASCFNCNRTKSNKLLAELGWTIGDEDATVP